MKFQPKIPRTAFVLAFVALFAGISQDLVAPILPAYFAALGFSRTQIGLIDGLLQASVYLFRFISGTASDALKHRKLFVITGYALSLISRPLLAAVSALPALIGLRIVDGIGKGTKDAPRDAMIADASTQKQGRAFGFHRLVDTAGSVIGPAIASLLLIIFTTSLSTYRLVLGLSFIPGIIALGLLIFGLRESEAERTPTAATKERIPTAFWFICFVFAFASLSRINESLLLTRALDLGVQASFIPLLFAGFTLLYAATSYPIGLLYDRWHSSTLLGAGWLIFAGSQYLLAYELSLPLALVAFAGYGLFLALTEVSVRAMIAELVPQNRRGLAYGVFAITVGLALIGGGYGYGKLWDTVSPQTSFHIAAAASLASSMLFLTSAKYLRPLKRSRAYIREHPAAPESEAGC